MPIRLLLHKFLKEDGNSMNFARSSLCRFSPIYLSQDIVFDVPPPSKLNAMIALLKRKMHGKEE